MKRLLTLLAILSSVVASYALPKTIDSDYTIEAGTTEYATSACTQSSGTFTIEGTLSMDVAKQYALALIGGKLIVADGGKLISPTSNSLYSGTASNFVIRAGGDMVIEKGGYVQNGKIGLENGKLTINQENGIVGMIDSAYKHAFLCPVTDNGVVYLNASQGFVMDMRNMSDGIGATITFKKEIGNDAILTISDAFVNGNVDKASVSMVFENFDTRSLFLETENHTEYAVSDDGKDLLISFRDPAGNKLRTQTYSLFTLEDGKEVDFESIILEAGTNNGVSGYWVYDSALVVAVPEPAEWAVIFGALALGFAIYRKRK